MPNFLDVIRQLLAPNPGADEFSRTPSPDTLNRLLNPFGDHTGAFLPRSASTAPDGDRLPDPVTARVGQAFDTVAGGPQDPAIEALLRGGQMPAVAPVPTARPQAQPDPMQTASVPQRAPAGDPYLAWQRGLGSSDDMLMPSRGRPMAGGGGQASLVGGSGEDRLESPSSGQGGGLGSFLQGLLGQGAGSQQKLAAQWLQKQGLDEGMAMVVAGNPDLLRTVVGKSLSGGGMSDFDERAAAAEKYGMQPGTPDYQNFVLSGDMPDARGGAAEMSLQTIPVIDENGDAALLQVDKAGVGHKTKLPAGTKIAKAPIAKDTGTEIQLIDPVTREVVQTIPKNIAGAEAQKTIGKARGDAAFDIPRIEQNAQQTLEVIERLKNHPGRAGSTGFIQGRLPAYSGNTMDFQVALEQAKGKTFLEAYQTLKGGGQITEVEGAKAENAIARLNRAQSDEEFMAALDDFEDVVKKGLDRAREQAGIAAPQQPNQTKQRLRYNPSTGELE